MARTSETLTQKEIDTYQAFCREHNIVAEESEVGFRNADEISKYIAVTWGQDITPETLAVALGKLRDRIVSYSPAQAEYLKVANQEPDRANQLTAWLATQGKAGQLVNQGDKAFDNLRLLLLTLRGYEISPPRISDALPRGNVVAVAVANGTVGESP